MPFLIFGFLFSFQTNSTRIKLPFDQTNPIIYDNDDHRDMYTDEYLFALASAREVSLKGIISTYSGGQKEYDLFVRGRQEMVQKARKSGFGNLPDPIAGPNYPLVKPSSNRMEDTKSIQSEAGKVIVEEALKTTPEKPLVVIAGGQLTAIADAYLQDPAIADRIVVCGIFGVNEKTYNAGLDAWAWTIVLSKFKCVSIADSDDQSKFSRVFQSERPSTPKQKFEEDLRNGIFPRTAYFEWIVEKRHPVHPAVYMEYDGDTPAAIPLIRQDYVTEVERWSCVGIDEAGMPKLVSDGNGPLYLVTGGDSEIATQEFWRVLENPKSWRR